MVELMLLGALCIVCSWIQSHHSSPHRQQRLHLIPVHTASVNWPVLHCLLQRAKATCSCLVAEQDEKPVSGSAHCLFVASCSCIGSGSLQCCLYTLHCSPCAENFRTDKGLPRLTVWRMYMAWPVGLRCWDAGNISGTFCLDSWKEIV